MNRDSERSDAVDSYQDSLEAIADGIHKEHKAGDASDEIENGKECIFDSKNIPSAVKRFKKFASKDKGHNSSSTPYISDKEVISPRKKAQAYNPVEFSDPALNCF